MSVSLRVLAGAIVALGIAVAALVPNGHVCRETDAVEVRRQWSYSQERWFYGCWPSQDVIDRGIPYRPTDAHTDSRIPLRILAAATGLVIAWVVVARERRRSPKDGEQQPAAWIGSVPAWVLVAFSALGGASIALGLTLREDPYCILRNRAPGGLSCPYRSFFGWDTEPILVAVLFAILGAAGGATAGLLAARRAKLAAAP